ncbi:MAG: PAS domain-containing protein [Gammaproteobacteria bacterium]|nr:PAS domain-containing protein [Gammaproteobacteria bacterium]
MLLFVNRRFEQLFRVTYEAMTGKTDYDVFPSATAENFQAIDRHVFAAGRV